MLKKLAVIAVLFLSILSARASDHIKVNMGDGSTSHGTSFVMDGLVITCAHVMGDKKVAEVYRDGAWVKCELVKANPEMDIAILKPLKKLKEDKPPKGWVCMAGRGSELVITPLPVSHRINLICVQMPGFQMGGSGSPIYKDGKLYGMAFAMRVDVNGPTGEVLFVPIELIRLEVASK